MSAPLRSPYQPIPTSKTTERGIPSFPDHDEDRELVRPQKPTAGAPRRSISSIPSESGANIFGAGLLLGHQEELDADIERRSQYVEAARRRGGHLPFGVRSHRQNKLMRLGRCPLLMNNVHRAITRGLRLRGIDALTVQDDGPVRPDDPARLRSGCRIGRVLFSTGRGLLAEAKKPSDRKVLHFLRHHLAHQLHVTIGDCIRDLELMPRQQISRPRSDRVEFLPL